jgi:hypothetical protein
MPLQNRVDPFGSLFADPARGLFMGNRGGRIHSEERTLGFRRFVSKQWICCRLEFNKRQRVVWGNSYTELFFLDEVTALAAGHRPCFECRRQDAKAFAECWQQAFRLRAAPRAHEMDEQLHAERLDGAAKRWHRRKLDELPDGAMVTSGKDAFAVRGDRLLRWTPSGYGQRKTHPAGAVDVLSPPAIIAVLARGYQPHWHPSAGDIR